MEAVTLSSRILAAAEQRNESWTADHIALCEIAAPPFGEGPRGEAFAARLQELGLLELTTDEVGNVYGRYPRSGSGPRLAVSAHLDTVFGPEVDCTVTRHGSRLRAPGISDDVAGLVLLLALAEHLGEAEVELPGELWLVATVGEENVGNLRGARKIAADGVQGRPLDGFITLDTATPGHIIRHGTHSHNFDVTLSGPGGHAWGDFGVVNPSLTVARIVAAVSGYALPTAPRTTINCGILEGGFAPNAIPQQARAHLNLRSESGQELGRLIEHASQAIAAEIATANAGRVHGPELGVQSEVSSRPGGETALESRLVRAAVATAEALGQPVAHPYSSTD
ncbi:MAG: M20/M25/M40 family metallo-hydrolase, partial [Armatimonadetes bacterium]|nr:M20/M25/M40 family metallo-hydrolase [Armatimonadota bacterium]